MCNALVVGEFNVEQGVMRTSDFLKSQTFVVAYKNDLVGAPGAGALSP